MYTCIHIYTCIIFISLGVSLHLAGSHLASPLHSIYISHSVIPILVNFHNDVKSQPSTSQFLPFPLSSSGIIVHDLPPVVLFPCIWGHNFSLLSLCLWYTDSTLVVDRLPTLTWIFLLLWGAKMSSSPSIDWNCLVLSCIRRVIWQPNIIFRVTCLSVHVQSHQMTWQWSQDNSANPPVGWCRF